MQKLLSVFISYLICLFILVFCIKKYGNIDVGAYTLNSKLIVTNWKELKLIKTLGTPVLDFNSSENSTSFYISHPPFSYYFLYFSNIILGINDYIWINVFITSITAFFIFLIVNTIFLNKAQIRFSRIAFISGLLYLLNPYVVYFQVFNFHPDIFVQVFLVVFTYIILKLFYKNRYHSPKYLMLIFIILFLMSYSSWLGIFYTMTIISISFFNLRKQYKMFVPTITASIAFLLALSIVLIQYATVDGTWNFITSFKNLYLKESYLNVDFIHAQKNILIHFFTSFWPFFIIYAFLTFTTLRGHQMRFLFTKNGYRYLVLSFMPFFFFYVFLFNYAQNEYTILYFIPVLIVITIVWCEKLKVNVDKKILMPVLSLYFLLNFMIYLQIFFNR